MFCRSTKEGRDHNKVRAQVMTKGSFKKTKGKSGVMLGPWGHSKSDSFKIGRVELVISAVGF